MNIVLLLGAIGCLEIDPVKELKTGADVIFHALIEDIRHLGDRYALPEAAKESPPD